LAKKRSRPSVARPDPGDDRATLHFWWMRADYLRQCWREASNEGENAVGLERAVQLESGYGLPIWVLATMHLASLHTVVEGWRCLGLSNPAVETALADGTNVQRLRDLRDAIFHYGAINSPAVMDVLRDTVFLSWARDLHQAFGALLESG
jgi:hypothetical protein